MLRALREQELGPDRDHVGSHVGSAHDLESRCAQVLGPLRDTDLRERPARKVLAQGPDLGRGPAFLLGDH
jgi:hypothetical protein